MKSFNKLIISLSIISFVSCNNVPQSTKTPETPEEAVATLLEGNRRFVNEDRLNPNSNLDRVKETVPHQEPFAAIIGCSDSRVPIELIFDQGVGDIFVIRTAGNNVEDDMVMGSIEYAVEHLGVKVLVVLGHSSCGGITSAITPGEHSSALNNLLQQIRNDIPEFVGKPELLDEAIHAHTDSQIETLFQNSIVAENIKKGKLIIKGAHYDIHTGKVTFSD
ncbi:MAG: carbonic anhydrase [Parabacteroides sp.]|nr:carbonic anhydrase [Parabacteroides sp.]